MDIADQATKVLLNGFVESVKSLGDFSDATDEEKEKEFRCKLFGQGAISSKIIIIYEQIFSWLVRVDEYFK